MRDKIARRLARVMHCDVQAPLPHKPLISITFDDVILTACTAGADLLERFDARATWYVSGGFEEPDAQGRFHDRAHLQNLQRAGHEMACHGFAHLNYQHLSDAQMTADLDRNLAYFKDSGLPAPRNFAFPYGAVSPRVKTICAPRFKSCRGIQPGLNGARTDLNLLRAVPLYTASLSVQDTRRTIDDLAQQGGWLTFLTHGVTDSPDAFDCTPAHLETVLAHAASLDIPVVTVDQALNRLFPARFGNQIM